MASSHGKQNGASITNVAALADVSIATVSRVLSGRRTKDDDIARRVRKAAHELNYSANSAASALRSDVSNTIALSMPATSTLMAASVVTAISEAVSAAHMQLLVGIDGTAAAQHRRIKEFCRHPADGIIVLPCPHAGVSLTRGIATDTPIIQLLGSTNLLRHDWISIDNGASIELAVTHVVERGATSVAYLSDAVGSSDGAETLLAFQSSLNMLRVRADSAWITIDNGTVQRGFADTMRMFGGGTTADVPEAVICSSSDTAIGVLIALGQLSISVPGQVQVVSLQDNEAAASSSPALTSMRAPLQQMAAESLRLIANARANGSGTETGPRLGRHVMFPRRVIARESTREGARESAGESADA